MSTQNQYATPQSNLDAGGDGYGEVKIFSASGRLGRLRYLAYTFGISLVGMIIIGVLSGGMAAGGTGIGFISGLLILIVYIVLLVISFMLTIQRCHDFNASGWLSLLLFVPLAPLIFWFVPGTEGSNNYGAPPPPNSTLVTIAGLLIPILFIVSMFGVMAAIAIPAYNQYIQAAQQASQGQ